MGPLVSLPHYPSPEFPHTYPQVLRQGSFPSFGLLESEETCTELVPPSYSLPPVVVIRAVVSCHQLSKGHWGLDSLIRLPSSPKPLVQRDRKGARLTCGRSQTGQLGGPKNQVVLLLLRFDWCRQCLASAVLSGCLWNVKSVRPASRSLEYSPLSLAASQRTRHTVRMCLRVHPHPSDSHVDPPYCG